MSSVSNIMPTRNSQSTFTITNSTIGVLNSAGNVRTRDIHCSPKEELELEYFDLPRLITSFKGREEEMQALNSLFFLQNKKKIVICGLPGYGKSELAKNYATRCIENKIIDKIFWIKSDKKDVLVKSSKTLKKMYNLFEKDRCLYIFDNGLARQDIFDYEPPQNPNFFLLITSQEKDWGDDVVPIRLDPLCLESAVHVFQSILHSKYKKEDKVLYEELAHVVGNVPLGLQISGAYIREQMMALGEDFEFGEYIELLKQSEEDILDVPIPSSSPNTYQKSIYGAIKLSLNKIETMKDINKRDLALNILYICSYLHPDHIELDVLLEMSTIKTILNENNYGKNKLIAALRLLDNYSFVNYQQYDFCIIHRFTQDVVRFHLSKHPEELTSCYTACLQFAIDNSNDLDNIIHAAFILVSLYAEQNKTHFYNFYVKHLPKDSKILEYFLHLLIFCNCVDGLRTIINTVDQKKEFIYEFNLLFKAAKYNRINILELLIHYDININHTDKNLHTALHIAASEWSLDAIRVLIANGANLNIINIEGDTALFNFCRGVREYVKMDEVNEVLELFKINENKNTRNNNGRNLLHVTAGLPRHNVELLNLLLQRGFDVNSRDENQATPIFAAAFEWNIDALNFLINHNADLNVKTSTGETALFYCMYGLHEQKNIIIEKVNDIFDLLKFEEYKNSTNYSGQNLVHYAATFCRHNIELLNLLIKRGLNINCTDKDQNTPTHAAASQLNLGAIKIFKENNADLETRNNAGDTALFYYIRGTYEHENINMDEVNEIFDIFKLEDNKNVRNNEGEDLLYIVCANRRHSKELLNLLLQRGFDVNTTYENQIKPLHIAAAKFNLDAIKLLIENNADINARSCNDDTVLNYFLGGVSSRENLTLNELMEILKLFNFEDNKHFINNEGKNLLHYEAEICRNNTDFLNLLVQSGLKVNSTDIYQNTPLHIASQQWNLSVMQFLINNNADINCRNSAGNTALLTYLFGACTRENINLDEVNISLNLLGCKKNKNVRNNDNHNILCFAALSCFKELVTLLVRDYKMNVNHQDLYGDTVLHNVIINFDYFGTKKQEDVIGAVEVLKRHGARLNIRNINGKTPLQIAQDKKNAEFLIPFLSNTDSGKLYNGVCNLRNIFCCNFLQSHK